MIVFDLACAGGHVFEAWFGSQADFEGQRGRGLVACPVCGDPSVEKAPMAPRIASRAEPVTSPAEAKEAMKLLARMQAKMLEGSEHVGRRFAEEARAIHCGDADERPIHGQASPAEARQLVRDGIAITPLPLPVREPARDN